MEKLGSYTRTKTFVQLQSPSSLWSWLAVEGCVGNDKRQTKILTFFFLWFITTKAEAKCSTQLCPGGAQTRVFLDLTKPVIMFLRQAFRPLGAIRTYSTPAGYVLRVFFTRFSPRD